MPGDAFFRLIQRVRTPALAVAAATALCAVAPAQADQFQIRYSIRLLGVPLGTAALVGSVESTSYRLEATAKLSGVASVISNARGAANSSGVFVQGRIAPNGFATTSMNAQATRTIRIAMQAGTVRASEILPPFESPPDRIPVLASQTHNVVDPLSGMLMPVAAGAPVVGPAGCDRQVPVFDGWTRFDIAMAFAGLRDMKIKGYAGPVAVCSVRYVPVSGHRDRPVVRFMADNRDIDTWIAPLGSSNMGVPLRIAVKTLIGMLTIEATEFSIGDPPAATR